jgi:hypothetical protein
MDIKLALIYFSTISGFFPVLAAFYNYKHLDKVLKIAALFFLVASFFDPITWLWNNSGEKNNMPIFHFNIWVSMVFYTLIYYHLFNKSILKKITLALTGITILLSVLFDRNIYDYPSISNTSLSISVIILSLIYFYQLLNPLKYIDIEKQGLFWINAGALFYSSVNIFLFMLLTHIPVDDRASYYIINSISNIIANILFSIGLLCKPQKTT